MSNRKRTPDALAATCVVDVKPLRAAIAGVIAAVQRRVTIPILAHVLLDVRDGAIRITATDLERAAEASAPVDALAQPFRAAVPGLMLADIVRSLPDGGEATLGLTADRATLVVTCGRARMDLRTLPPDDYPAMSKRADGAVTMAIPARDLAHLFTTPQQAVSTEETRYYLNGIHMHIAGDRLRAVATDGHRLVQCDVALPDGAAGMPAVIVPRAAVGDFAKAAAEAGDDTVALVVSPATIELTTAHRRLTSKLIDGTYPDYARVIPSGAAATTVTIDVAEFAAAIGRVEAAAGRDAKAVRLEIGDGAVGLSMRAPEGHGGADEVDADITGKAVEVGYNSAYLVRAIEAAGADRVTLHIHDTASPMRITAADSDVVAVVMPMRVS